ncbi:hypothetical protein AYI68_g4392 [Smittium mucronatum]|uniref:Uncharacterized protein n=1 Tax=Smittium mucronatum TaxID=133383 RepID=A0A1R0GXC5_9FUNG|nr:hypothetical protein AYI68_g4392 [Smittium mucronatum]
MRSSCSPIAKRSISCRRTPPSFVGASPFKIGKSYLNLSISNNKWTPSIFGASTRGISTDHEDKELLIEVGKTTQTLLRELESFFEKGLDDQSIYSEDVVLKELTHSRLSFRGRYKNPEFRVIRVRQGSVEDGLDPEPQKNFNEWAGWVGPHGLQAEEEVTDQNLEKYDIFVYWSFTGYNTLFRNFIGPNTVSEFNGLFSFSIMYSAGKYQLYWQDVLSKISSLPELF